MQLTKIVCSWPNTLISYSVNYFDSPPSSSSPTMFQESSLPAITLGGAIAGAVIAVMLAVVVIVILCVLIAMSRRRLRKENGIEEHEGLTLGNATYSDEGINIAL